MIRVSLTCFDQLALLDKNFTKLCLAGSGSKCLSIQKVSYCLIPILKNIADVVHHFCSAVDIAKNAVSVSSFVMKKVKEVPNGFHGQWLASALPLI